jgi:DNA-directed RNA polymerase alpha subunit
MNPSISNISEHGDLLNFTLSGINVSLANAIRRTILSDIPIVVFYTENHKENQCHITINNTRLHNEIIKHRLSCIPVHTNDLETLPDNYILELDIRNDTENMIIITTEDFKIRNKTNDNYLTKEEVRKIFPPNNKTNMFIDFARVRPRISDTIPGEQLQLTAEFSVHTAKENSMFNVVSKCSYGNTLDMVKINNVWEEQENKLRSEEMSKEDIEYNKKNFYILDAQRHFIADSFDFAIQTVGVLDNTEIVKKSCIILQNKFVELIKSIDSEIIPINIGNSTIDNCFDIVLEDEDYTIGKVLEYILYEKYYVQEKIFSFCGFKKIHPHNSDSIIRIAYKQNNDKKMAEQHLRMACMESAEFFKKVYSLF